ncbi:hypothetical protein IscW_ISCW012965 [Ixodes scapularis]|uniref:OB domain-containing protein n=1 Tax=Ixodes scapularis TaxID=6945 RepID=B7QBB7_IXOSC|nr:hypothetical protein IscW_ISCW012965 [Ixodes scapularis]|eukprot:XP_002412843.1 hypothetical protein IscW_ISCW012965 [Ixodes scapularis]
MKKGGGGFMSTDFGFSQATPQRKESVTVVGLVTHVDQQSTKVSYTVDDRTGPPLEGHIFATEPEEQARILSQLVEGTYVRVVGSVRSVDGRRDAEDLPRVRADRPQRAHNAPGGGDPHSHGAAGLTARKHP